MLNFTRHLRRGKVFQHRVTAAVKRPTRARPVRWTVAPPCYHLRVAALYELFLRVPAGATLAAEELTRAAAAGAAPGVQVELYLGEGRDPRRPRGADLTLTADGDPEALLKVAFGLAAGLGLEVFDPQLGAAVTEADGERVRAHCEELRTFHADTLGEAGALAHLPATVPVPDARRARLHLWLLVLGVVVAFLLLARGCRYFI
jgi:hypothetical protein